MDLTSYTGLKAAIASYLNRADLTEQIPAFISLAEARFNRELRLNAMQQRDQVTIGTSYLALPLDWLAHHSLVMLEPAGTIKALDYITTEAFNDMRKAGVSGLTRYYTIVANSIALLPAPGEGTKLEIVYYAKIPVLSAEVQSNWLLARSPDLYLYGALLNAEPYLINDERVPLWAGAVEATIGAMRKESEEASRPRGALRVRPRTFG